MRWLRDSGAQAMQAGRNRLAAMPGRRVRGRVQAPRMEIDMRDDANADELLTAFLTLQSEPLRGPSRRAVARGREGVPAVPRRADRAGPHAR